MGRPGITVKGTHPHKEARHDPAQVHPLYYPPASRSRPLRLRVRHRPRQDLLGERPGLQGPGLPGFVRKGHPCPDEPFSAMFHVMDEKGTEVASFKSDAHGRFSLRLLPGTYTIVPDASSGLLRILPGNIKTTVVNKGTALKLAFHFDTGMH